MFFEFDSPMLMWEHIVWKVTGVFLYVQCSNDPLGTSTKKVPQTVSVKHWKILRS